LGDLTNKPRSSRTHTKAQETGQVSESAASAHSPREALPSLLSRLRASGQNRVVGRAQDRASFPPSSKDLHASRMGLPLAGYVHTLEDSVLGDPDPRGRSVSTWGLKVNLRAVAPAPPTKRAVQQLRTITQSRSRPKKPRAVLPQDRTGSVRVLTTRARSRESAVGSVTETYDG